MASVYQVFVFVYVYVLSARAYCNIMFLFTVDFAYINSSPTSVYTHGMFVYVYADQNTVRDLADYKYVYAIRNSVYVYDSTDHANVDFNTNTTMWHLMVCLFTLC